MMPGVNDTLSRSVPTHPMLEPETASGMNATYQDGASLYVDVWDEQDDLIPCYSSPLIGPTSTPVPGVRDEVENWLSEMMRRPWSSAPDTHAEFLANQGSHTISSASSSAWDDLNNVGRHHNILECIEDLPVWPTIGTPIPIVTPSWPSTPLPDLPTAVASPTSTPNGSETPTSTPDVTSTYTPMPTDTPSVPPTKTPSGPTSTPTPWWPGP